MLLVFAAIPSPLCAQVNGEINLSSGLVGISYENSHRDLRYEDGSEGSVSWDSGRISVGVGIGERIRGSLGGWYGPAEGESPPFSESEYRLVSFGGALSGYPYIADNFRLGVVASYRHYAWEDRSVRRLDLGISTYRIHVRIERPFQKASIWLGPAFHVDRLVTYRFGRLRFDAEGLDNLGAAAGGSILLGEHYLPFIQLAYVGGIQLHLGFGYQP